MGRELGPGSLEDDRSGANGWRCHAIIVKLKSKYLFGNGFLCHVRPKLPS
jgi:hypothetical protein